MIADFIDGERPLFEEARLTEILISFRTILTAQEYLTLSNRLCDSLQIPLQDRLKMVDVTDTASPGSYRQQTELAGALRIREQHEDAVASLEADEDRVNEATAAVGTLNPAR